MVLAEKDGLRGRRSGEEEKYIDMNEEGMVGG